MLPQDEEEFTKVSVNCKLNYKSNSESTEVNFEFSLDLPLSFWDDIKSALSFALKALTWLFKKINKFLSKNTESRLY